MAKTPSKRKAEAVTFEDDDDSSSSLDDADNNDNGGASNNDGEGDDDEDAPMTDNANESAAKTPRATSSQGKKTPGSSGGMIMRSGRKKKRSKSSNAATGDIGSAVAASATTATSTKPQRKRAKKQQQQQQAKEKNGGGDDEKKNEDSEDDSSDGEGEESEDEEMADEENDTNKTKASAATATTVKATKSPETAREAVAMAQVTGSTSTVDEGEEEDEFNNEGGTKVGEKEDKATTSSASAAPAPTSNGTSNNNNNANVGTGMGGGILRLVSQTLRLPSQHTPAAPASGGSAASSLASPVPPPPGGRRLIFTTAKKGNATTAATGGVNNAVGGGNKLLLQTRQTQQQQGTTPKDKLPQSSTAGNEEPQSVQRTHFQQQQQQPNNTTANSKEESTSLLAHLKSDLHQNYHQYQTDVILYTKAWFTLLLAVLLVSNALTTVANGNFIKGLGRWHVKGQGVVWMEWYGLDYADYTQTMSQSTVLVGNVAESVDDDVNDAEDDAVEEEEDNSDEEEEEEIIIETITKTITLPNPTLLSTAQNRLRAHRINLHEIDVLDQNMAELTDGLTKLNVNLKGWKEIYPEYDFEMVEEEEEEFVSSSGIVKRLGGGGGGGEMKEKGSGVDGEVGGEMVKTLVLEEISSSDVVIFSKSYCPHCKATKELFHRLSTTTTSSTTNFHIRVIELDVLPNGKEIQSMLYQLTDQKTVPNIFVKGRHVGGNNDVQVAAKSGDLEELLVMDMAEFEPITHPDSEYSSGEEVTVERAKKPMYNKIDDIKSDIAKKQTSLAEWERVLVGAEEILELLDKGEISPAEVNAVMDALAGVSMLKDVAASVLDVEHITLPGEGCEGVDYVPLKLEIEEVDAEEDGDDDYIEEEADVDVELQEEDAIEGEIVDVVGAIDVDALDVASDVPVRLEDAQSVYESLLRLSQTTSEALVGETSGPSSYAEKWVKQIIQQELHEKEVDVDPPSVEEVHTPLVAPENIVTKEKSSSISTAGDYSMMYTAGNAVRDIDRLLEMEDADRTGKFDYASIVNGARVLRRGPYATSYSYYETLPLFNRFLAMAKLRFYGHPPEVALLPNTGSKHTRGQCWSFPSEFDSSRSRRQANDATNDGIRGEYATLTVSLASAISVTEVIIEHIPPMISSNPPTAIRDFRVVGFEDGGAYGEPWELGTYTFSIGPSLTSFTIPTMLDGQNVPKLKSIAIAIDSNNGAEYACLYRVRVHGA